MSTPPATAADVAQQLGQLCRDLDVTVQQLEEADGKATRARAEFDLAYAKAFLSADGAMDVRRYTAVVNTYDQRVAADVADALVRNLRRRIDATKVRIEAGRSFGAAIRAELSLGGIGSGA